jgi:hypothetical protein
MPTVNVARQDKYSSQVQKKKRRLLRNPQAMDNQQQHHSPIDIFGLWV